MFVGVEIGDQGVQQVISLICKFNLTHVNMGGSMSVKFGTIITFI